MDNNERSRVWLGVAGLVENELGEWLVVMKRYGGLDGKWSLPAGFVKPGETVDEACQRELKEETNVHASMQGFLGFRTGVLQYDISDNLAVFYLTAHTAEQHLEAQLDELYEVRWMAPEDLADDPRTSLMILELLDLKLQAKPIKLDEIEDDNVFGYTAYKLFF
ncbi:NUDIX domain-containing protein [Kurthia huakuii]|jgi:ADP-ribose pyrophosphatase YjhB (NUDIX family)|uniref:NUDIX domain-containing protein n=1 Tax=Kurthia huakuii TaxID=1421019 RepID=UPI000497AF0F|nr:NUDIX hydrolase [Kurthia huakuii]MBM7700270.1 ADP-ribose pyrophosphatase YjhB (NUDIX family) [Kurthia huakuii]